MRESAINEETGTLAQIPRELRDQILTYVVDINCKREEYAKGIEAPPEESVKHNNGCGSKHRNVALYNLWVREKPLRRTNILAVSKILYSQERLST